MLILIRLSGFAFRYKRRLLLAYMVTIAAAMFAMAIPWLLGNAVDAAQQGLEFRQLLYLALLIISAGILRGAAAYGQTYLGESLGQKVAYDIRNAFYERLQRLSFAFHDNEQTGNLMSKATADVEGVRMFIQMGLVRVLYMFLLVSTISILLFALNWRLALVSLGFINIIVWRASLVSFRMRRIWAAVQTEMGNLTAVLQENLSGQRVVKAFAAEEHERGKFHSRARNVSNYSYQASVLQASNTAINNLFFLGGTGFVLWFGGREVIFSRLSIGDLTQFILYLGLLAAPVRMTGWLINTFARASSSGERIFAVLDAESPVKEKQDAAVLPRLRGHVRFENVSFSYDSLSPVVKDVVFEAYPGQVIALLGAPGSGKSTVVHMVPRFYDVTKGRVTIDGTDVRDVTLASLRSNVGIVQQDVFIFTSTIRENIAYGIIDASLEQIVRAAKIAQLHDFIEGLADGYDTWVGERGVTLSGGQRQRLAIARTILLDPPILLLDDSTSSVDTQTEQLIRQALAEAIQGRTTFIIAHRLSTVKNADLILVLKEGQVVQRGTHQELIQQPGTYQEIYELQLQTQERTPTAGSKFHDDGEHITQQDSRKSQASDSGGNT
jgi:ABC-type multidrug transport system fused ATPase/permease subunit